MLNNNEKLLFIALKKYADKNNQCFPSMNKLSEITGMSKRTVQGTKKTLIEKGVIRVEARTKEDGGQTSNLYTLYDFPEMWQAETEDAAEVIGDFETKKMIQALESMGYEVNEKSSGFT